MPMEIQIAEGFARATETAWRDEVTETQPRLRLYWDQATQMPAGGTKQRSSTGDTVHDYPLEIHRSNARPPA